LKAALEPVQNLYDYILIDCPPSLGILTLNGFAAANRVLIPLQCEFLALEGLLGMIFNTVHKVQQGVNPSLEIGGIIFTMYDKRIKFANAVINSVRNTFIDHPDYIFNTIIPRNVRLSEAPSHALPISIYYPDCAGAKSYKALAKEVIERG
ncbi:MAG: ParA family protein, partial [Spirochaetota bacterium]